MFSALNIPKKLALAFVMICASAAIMMAVFGVNIWMISASTDRNNLSQSIHAKALSLETALLRQNSQFRGFMVTADPSYLKSYYEARDDYDRTSVVLEKLLTEPAKLDQVRKSREATLAWRRDWGDRLIDWVRNGRRDDAQMAVRAAGPAVMITAAVLPLRAVRDAETKLISENSSRQETAITTATITLVIGGIALIGVAWTLAMLLGRIIARPIAGLTHSMAELAAGNNAVAIPDTDRRDELGDMARAVMVFRDAAVTKLADDQDRHLAIAEIGKILHRLAESDLTVRLKNLPDTFGALAEDFNDAMVRLSEAMRKVRGSVESIKTNSGEIRQAADNLSARSEKQAASVRKSAAAMGKITDMVREGASHATNANAEVAQAQHEAREGGEVVCKTIQAMNEIEQASKEIAEIISVIDGIAFQTNLLALNAGVEAARAGDAGKGFAVVASEVRALAQRAADAATDVKTRINSSTEHVKVGVQLVDETGRALNRITERVSSVSAAICAMAESSAQQSRSLIEVNAAISEIDSVTQQNAAMVEETTAASALLAKEAQELADVLGTFTVDTNVASLPGFNPVALRPAQHRQSPPPPPRSAARGAASLAAAGDDWAEF